MSESSQEARAVRDAFRAQLDRRRRYYFSIGIPFLVLILAGGSMVLVPARSAWALIPLLLAMGSLLALLVMAFVGPRLKCPRCGGKLDRSIDLYCPECGSQDLRQYRWPRRSRCESCGRTLDRDLGRTRGNWVIRYCTHCGVLLDERGA